MMARGSLPTGVARIDPYDPMTVFVVDPDKNIVHRSVDGAATFEWYATFDAHTDRPALPAHDAGDPPIWIRWQGSIYMSRDRALTWQRLPAIPLERTSPDPAIQPIRVVSGDPRDPLVVFALVRGDEIWMYRQPSPNLPAE